MNSPVIFLFRRDLRLSDNPALSAAAASGAPLIPLFVLDDDDPLAPGGASRWWLHHSLRALSSDLQKRGASFVLRRGNTAKVLLDLAKSFDASTVYWNRRYAPDHVALDTDLKSMLTDAGLDVVSENGALLREPWEIKTGGGGHFKVFSPFWRALQKAGPGRIEPAPAPRKFTAPERAAETDALENWNLTPSAPNWATAFPETWTPGEKGAKARLDAFLKSAAARYDDHRNRPDFEGTSRLSPHLAFGEISPLQIWAATKIRLDAGDVPETPAMTFLSEIAWREFSHVLLYHYADLRSAPIRPDFERFPWRNDEKTLNAWRRGRTGYPIVDAGMRELWTTGWMHNRVRMITASFLVKHLLSPWQEGEKWFWDTLVDADPANNAASWQWSAGCGADAAPYFRIFNPMTQGEKFDPDGAYTRKYVPELAELPNKYLQKPWTAPAAVLKDAGVVLGDTYPEPIVDHAAARQAALDAFNSIKKT